MEMHYFVSRELDGIRPCSYCGQRSRGRVAVPVQLSPLAMVNVVTLDVCGECYLEPWFSIEHVDVGRPLRNHEPAGDFRG